MYTPHEVSHHVVISINGALHSPHAPMIETSSSRGPGQHSFLRESGTLVPALTFYLVVRRTGVWHSVPALTSHLVVLGAAAAAAAAAAGNAAAAAAAAGRGGGAAGAAAAGGAGGHLLRPPALK
jgi:hypothetical protein